MRPLLLIWFLCLSFQGISQNTFNRFYGTIDSEYGTDVLQTVDGGYMLIIQTQYLGMQLPVLVKTDCRGYIEWTKGVSFGSSTSSFDMVNCLGNAVVVLVNYQEAGTGLTAVMKIDLLGNLVWCKSIAMQCGYLNAGIIMENTGNFVLCGNPNTTSGASPSVAIVKMHEAGNILAQTKLDFTSPVNVMGITMLPNGDYAVTGNYPSSLPGFKDVYVMTVTNDLTFKKAVVLDSYYDDEPHSITSDESGSIYVSGQSYFLASQWDAMLLKFNSTLDLQYANFYDAGTPQGECFRHIIKTSDVSVAMCGDIGAFDERNATLTKINYAGNIVFSKEYPMSPLFTNYFFKVNETSEGGFVLTGDIRPPSVFRDGPIVKTNKYGDDQCYAQDFWFTKLNPAVTTLNATAINSVVNVSIHDTVPVFINVPIHNVENCSTTGPCPGFNFTAQDICDAFCFDFTNASSFATQWNWTFEGGSPSTSTLENPSNICFNSVGVHNVTLTVSDGMDTSVLVKQVEVQLDCEPVIPNVFTPNGDGINDVFEISPMPANYTLHIFNRWGNVVYTAVDLPVFWNGTKDGKKVSQGVYYYAFKNTLNNKEYKGFIEVLY